MVETGRGLRQAEIPSGLVKTGEAAEILGVSRHILLNRLRFLPGFPEPTAYPHRRRRAGLLWPREGLDRWLTHGEAALPPLQPGPPEFAMLKDITELLGVAVQTAFHYSRRADFPPPVGLERAGGRYWRLDDIVEWNAQSRPPSWLPANPITQLRKLCQRLVADQVCYYGEAIPHLRAALATLEALEEQVSADAAHISRLA